MVRHYSKLLGLRAWNIIRRPVWAVIVFFGALYTFLQVVARLFAERLVSMFDALYQWDPLYQWWYVPLAVVVLGVLLRAGYELWNEEKQVREKAQAQLRKTEQERKKLKEELEAAQSSVSRPVPSTAESANSLATINRLTDEKDELKKEVQKYKNNDWWRQGVYRKLEAERDALREEKRQNLQDQRRKRIQEWRDVISDFDFDAEKFASTDTYSQMKSHLQPDVRRRLEQPGMIFVGNEARGGNMPRYTLLDEVAKIEKKWELV